MATLTNLLTDSLFLKESQGSKSRIKKNRKRNRKRKKKKEQSRKERTKKRR